MTSLILLLSRNKKKQRKRKSELYNTYHELLSKKQRVKRSHFHVSYIISPKTVAIFATSHLGVVLNISAIVLRTTLIRVQQQHPIKQAGLTIHSKPSLVRNSDNAKHKTQKLCNENPRLKSTDLLRIRGSLKTDQSQLPQSLIA